MWVRYMPQGPCQMGATLPQLGRMAPYACGMCTPTDALPGAPSPQPRCEFAVLSCPVLTDLWLDWSPSWRLGVSGKGVKGVGWGKILW